MGFKERWCNFQITCINIIVFLRGLVPYSSSSFPHFSLDSSSIGSVLDWRVMHQLPQASFADLFLDLCTLTFHEFNFTECSLPSMELI